MPANPTLTSLRPAPVSSPHGGRHVNSSSVLECFLGAVLAQNRPARTPPSPPPMSLSPFHLQASPIHAGLFFSSVHLLPCPHATSHCVFPHLTRLSLSSAPAQLSSRVPHTLERTRTRASAACSCCGRHGTAGQARFIHSTCCMGLLCAQYQDADIPTHTHTHALLYPQYLLFLDWELV